MKIGELARRTDVPTRTIRFWEAEGLLAEPARTAAGYRDYDEATTGRIAFIRQSQSAGLTLAQIRQILGIADDGAPPCAHVAAAVEERLAEVNARIRKLQATRQHLEALTVRAATQDPGDCTGYCSIIESP